MKVLMILVVMVGFLYGIESKTLVTEHEMLNEFENGIADNIDKMPAEGFEETEKQLQQAPLDEEEPTDEAEQEEKVTTNGCRYVTRSVKGYFYHPQSRSARQCFTVSVVTGTSPVYASKCANSSFRYNNKRYYKYQCFTVQVGLKLVRTNTQKCWTYSKFSSFKSNYETQTITFRL